MTKSKLEYIWLDGYQPTQTLRSKTKIVENFSGKVEDAEIWSFDGSSTQQATGGSSDLLLKPVFVCPDPGRLGGNGFLVMCEVLNPDKTPHRTNGRATIDDDDEDFWFGFEQEYTLWNPDKNKPLGFPAEGYPAPQGPYYCSVGTGRAVGRDIIEEHLELCLQAGLNVEGINAEVMKGQWEFQVFAKGAEARWRPGLGRSLPAGTDRREVRHRHQLPLQAGPGRLERQRDARQLQQHVAADLRQQRGLSRGL